MLLSTLPVLRYPAYRDPNADPWKDDCRVPPHFVPVCPETQPEVRASERPALRLSPHGLDWALLFHFVRILRSLFHFTDVTVSCNCCAVERLPDPDVRFRTSDPQERDGG